MSLKKQDPDHQAFLDKIKFLREKIAGNLWCARFRRKLSEKCVPFEALSVGDFLALLQDTHDEIKLERFDKHKAKPATTEKEEGFKTSIKFSYRDENFL